MAVRCAGCDRLSRDEALCEWCGEEIPVEARQLASARMGARDAADSAAAAAVLADDIRPGGAPQDQNGGIAVGRAVAPGVGGPAPDGDPGEAVDEVSRGEARAAAAVVPEEEREADEAAAVDTEPAVEALERRQDRDTLVILVLILVQLALTLYLGRLASWWSVTGILWLLVGYGVKERAQWALALPLVLFTLDVAFLLFGIGPREHAGFPALAPLDFCLYFFRLVIWALIWRLRDELA